MWKNFSSMVSFDVAAYLVTVLYFMMHSSEMTRSETVLFCLVWYIMTVLLIARKGK